MAKKYQIKNKYQNTTNYPNGFWGDQLYHPHRRFFFDPKFSAMEDGFVDGRARAELKVEVAQASIILALKIKKMAKR